MTLWNYGRKLDFLLKETKNQLGKRFRLQHCRRGERINKRYLFWNVVVEVVCGTGWNASRVLCVGGGWLSWRGLEIFVGRVLVPVHLHAGNVLLFRRRCLIDFNETLSEINKSHALVLIGLSIVESLASWDMFHFQVKFAKRTSKIVYERDTETFSSESITLNEQYLANIKFCIHPSLTRRVWIVSSVSFFERPRMKFLDFGVHRGSCSCWEV